MLLSESVAMSQSCQLINANHRHLINANNCLSVLLYITLMRGVLLTVAKTSSGLGSIRHTQYNTIEKNRKTSVKFFRKSMELESSRFQPSTI